MSKRYIDAYALENRVEDFEILTGTKLDIVHDFVSSQPTEDVVEVVRCEDCIHNHTKIWNQGKRDKPSCRFTDLMRSNKFYCGFGERAEE